MPKFLPYFKSKKPRPFSLNCATTEEIFAEGKNSGELQSPQSVRELCSTLNVGTFFTPKQRRQKKNSMVLAVSKFSSQLLWYSTVESLNFSNHYTILNSVLDEENTRLETSFLRLTDVYCCNVSALS